jgi:hypothetical protein
MPDTRDVHFDRPLTNVSIGYQNLAYINDGVAPLLPVRKQTDLIPAYDQSHWFRDAAELRAPGTRARAGGFTVSHDTYYCPRYSYAFHIPDELRDNTDDPYDMDRDGTEFVTDKIAMRREMALATSLFKAGVWGTDVIGGTSGGGGDFVYFSDYANSDPLVVVDGYTDAMELAIGREPNLIVMGKAVMMKFRWHPVIIDLIKYTQRGVVTEDLLSSLINVPELKIGRAIYTADPEGTAEASVTYSRIWGQHMLMLWRPERPSLMRPSAAYTIVWQRVPRAMQYIRRIRRNEEEVDVIEGNGYFAHKVTAPKAGLFMEQVIAP